MADCLRFVLDGEVRMLHGVDPTSTVLQVLRRLERRSGTKEGCGEGDCGACTVVLGELQDGEVRYRAVNACILLAGALDGKALLTVESACGQGGALHPVQQAIVDCHGSQCGFCTPGFVMSLLALYESEPAPSRERIREVLAGNLCRCTGYRPLVDAAEQACREGRRPPLAGQEARLSAQLRDLARDCTLELVHGDRRWLAPRTLDAALELLARHPGARIVAGGTDVGVWVAKDRRELGTVISLGGIDELRDVRVGAEHVDLGAAATYADALAPLAAVHPSLATLVRRIGAQQVRNVGTIGGNLANASPVGDTAPALLALGATLVLRARGSRRELPIDQFFRGYRQTALRAGELLERIRIPLLPAGWRFATYKVSKRREQDISAVCGAFAVELDGGVAREVRIAYGGVAATPVRARACEDALRGRVWGEGAIAAALPALDGELAPLSDLRGSAHYRRLLARNLLRKFQLETAAAPARVLALAEEA